MKRKNFFTLCVLYILGEFFTLISTVSCINIFEYTSAEKEKIDEYYSSKEENYNNIIEAELSDGSKKYADSVANLSETLGGDFSKIAEIRIDVGLEDFDALSEALKNSSQLLKVVLNGEYKIASEMFSGCENLREVLLSGTSSIGSKTFSGCENLKEINYSGSAQEWLNLVEGVDTGLSEGTKIMAGDEKRLILVDGRFEFFTESGSEIIDFPKSESLPEESIAASSKRIEKGASATFTIFGEYEEYQWYVDGVKSLGAQNKEFVWDTEGVFSGVHEIDCVVQKEGNVCSASVSVVVIGNVGM